MSEADSIRVFPRDGRWIVDLGSSVWAYYDSRSQAIAAAAEAARDAHRGLVIDESDATASEPPLLEAVPGVPDAGLARMDEVAYSEYVNTRLAAVSREMLAHFLEGFDPNTATDDELARRTLLTDLARAERDRRVALTEHEEAQLDRLIAGQPPQSQEMYAEVRNTSPRHVLYMLRGLAALKEAGASALSPRPDPADEPTAG